MATLFPKRSIPRFQLTNKTPITIIRQSEEGEWVGGRWIEGESIEVIVDANVQPMRGHELLAFPESDRSRDSIKVYSVETLKTIDEVGQTHADIVVWNGLKYIATKTMTYQMGVLDHTKTICFRLPGTPENKATYPGAIDG